MSDTKLLDGELQSALTGAFGNRYQLSGRIGTGSYGVVFRAQDTMLERDVAIKQVRLDILHYADQAEEVKLRTQREAEITAKLRHAGIVAVHDIVHAQTSTLIIMEYVHGKTLQAELREQRHLGLEQTIEIIAQTADALDHAHARGVVHRDVKPANLMITDDGHVKLADFRIAEPQAGTEVGSMSTATGDVLGIPYYMSPEQARGMQLDGRSDLFSLGCVTYECLTGTKPFCGNSVIDLLLNIVNGEPAALDCDELELHADIEMVLEKALAKTSAARFRTARELVEALRAVPAVESARPLPVVTSRKRGASSTFDDGLQGSLSERFVADIIRDIQTSGKSGILHLQRDEFPKRLYFLDGAIVFANSDAESDRLGQFLISGGIIDGPSYERAARAMKKTGQRLGRTLVELGNLADERLDQMINDQIRSIIYSVFSWESGDFKFETIDKPVEDDLSLALSTDEIVLEGVRRMATESTIRHAVGNTDRILHHVEGVAADERNVTLTASEGFVLSRVDGRTSVDDIAVMSPLDDDETLRCIYGLLSAGILRLEDAQGRATGRVQRDSIDAHPLVTEPAKPASDDTDLMVAEIAAKRAALEQSNFYEILEVKPGDSPEAIKKSYFVLARKYHPDLYRSYATEALQDQLQEILSALSEAYGFLYAPPKRLGRDNKISHTEGVDAELVRAEAELGAEVVEAELYGAGSVEAELDGAEGVDAELDGAEGVDAELYGTVQMSPNVLAENSYRAGLECYQAQEYHGAVENLREAVRLDPTKIAYHKLLGQALTKNPKWHKQAEKHLRRVIDAEPYDPDCYLALAVIYEQGGMSMRARKMYEQVALLDPDHEVALEKLALEPQAEKTAFFRKFI